MLPAGPARQCEMQAFVTMSARVNNSARDARNMWPFSVVQMEELMRKIQREKLVVQSIKLSGHADRLNSTGQNDYNQRLSEKRVAAVKAKLSRLGIALALMSSAASGNTQQIQGCEQRFKAQTEMRECRLPSRWVGVVIEARRPSAHWRRRRRLAGRSVAVDFLQQTQRCVV